MAQEHLGNILEGTGKFQQKQEHPRIDEHLSRQRSFSWATGTSH